MGQKGDQSAFECGEHGSWCQTGFTTAAGPLNFSLGFTENGPKERQFPVNSSCVEENALLDVRGLYTLPLYKWHMEED